MPTDPLIKVSVDSLRKARDNLAAAGENVVKRNDTVVSAVLATLGSVPAFAAHATNIARRTASADAAVEAAVEDGTYAISRRLNRLKAALGAASVPDPAWAPIAATVRERSGSLESPAGPGRNATVEEISDWWARVDDDYRDLMVRDHADDLRHVDGIPIPVRDDLNQRQLLVDIDDLRSQLDTIQADMAEQLSRSAAVLAVPGAGMPGLPSPRRELKKLRKRKDELTGLLGGLNAVQAEIDKAAAEGREVFLIDYSLEGSGRLIFAYNDPDTSDTLTYLPGGATTLSRAEGSLEYCAKQLEMTERIDAGRQPPRKRSIVLHLYPCKEPVAVNMVLPTMAKDEAPVLARSLHGRQVTHVAADGEEEGADDTRFVVAGHSYGNIVAGVTAGEYGLAADAWAIGGVGWVRLRKAADADVPDVHATLAENDPLQKVAKVSKWAGQGPQPATDEFEANGIFASGPGPRGKLLGGTSMDAHYGYPKDSLFQHNVGAIFLGQPPTYTVPVYDAA